MLLTIIFVIIFIQSVKGVVIRVNDENDCDSSICLSNNTYFSLRSAWNDCQNIYVFEECVIDLSLISHVHLDPLNGPLVMNNYRNNLKISSDSHVVIESLLSTNQSSFIDVNCETNSSLTSIMTLSNMTIKGFIDDKATSGAISIVGYISTIMNNIIFMNNHGFDASAIYISHSQGMRCHNCSVIINDQLGYYLSHSFYYSSICIDYDVNDVNIDDIFLSLDEDTFGITIQDSNSNIHINNALITSVGAGLFLDNNNQDISITNSQIIGTYTLGGIYCRTNNELYIADVILDESFSGISFNGLNRVVMTDVKISNINGPGIAIFSSFANISNVFITNCTFGGILVADSNDLIASNISITNCESLSGGGISISQGSHFTLSNIYISYCIGTNSGGAIFLQSVDDIVISNLIISDCFSYSFGGGLTLEIVNDFKLTTATISRCYAYSSDSNSYYSSSSTLGGGIALLTTSNVVLHDITISDCYSISGGGVYVDNTSNFTIQLSSISNSYSYHNGGGLYLSSTTHASIDSSTITSCVSYKHGGGIHIASGSLDIHLVNNVIFNNSAVNGAGIFSTGPACSLIYSVNNQIIGNTASENGGGIFIGTDNSLFMLLDSRSYSNMKIVESTHPYECLIADNSVDLAAISIDSTIGYIIIIDSNSNINKNNEIFLTSCLTMTYSCDRVSLTPRQLNGGFTPIFISFSEILVSISCSYFVDVVKANGLYGVKMYIFPIYNNDDNQLIQSNMIQSNKAMNGGGIYSFNKNDYLLAFNTLIVNNEATQSGGGVVIDSSTIANLLYRVIISNNSANVNAGGLQINAANYGTLLYETVISTNVAMEEGGGLFLGSNNGIGAFFTNNFINISYCLFNDNTASDGGAIYSLTTNEFSIYRSSFLSNNASKGDGGAIAVNANLASHIDINDCIFDLNSAVRCGGAIASINSDISINRVTISSNSADVAGGVCISTQSTIQLSDEITLENNIAKSFGGSIAIYNSPMWSSNNAIVSIINNTADKGSGIFIYDLITSDNEISNASFIDNRAFIGGTVFWLYNGDMTNQPEGIDSNSIIWIDNIAPYGDQLATQAVQINTTTNYLINRYSHDYLSPPIVVKLYDYYNQLVDVTEPRTIASISLDSNAKCFDQIGRVTGDSISQLIIGNISFTYLQFLCSPKGNYTVSLDVSLASFETTLTTVNYNNLQKSIFVSFRDCLIGEIDTKGVCYACPFGSYSLKVDSKVCTECISIAGVDHCQSDQIYLQPGYWRRYNHTSTVLPCLLDPNSCIGGDVTGDSICSAGYEQALCAVCTSGYFLENNQCIQCKASNGITPSLIFLVVIISIVIIIALLIYNQSIRNHVDLLSKNRLKHLIKWFKSKVDIKSFTVKFKIILSTYQIVTATSTIFKVSLPKSFNRFSKAFNVFNLNISNVFPLNCMVQSDFFHGLLITTVVPLVFTVALLVCYAVEQYYNNHKRNIKQTSFGDIRQVDEEINNEEEVEDVNDSKSSKYFNAYSIKSIKSKLSMIMIIDYDIMNKYLIAWFYLTYLILPSITTLIFQSYICTDIDPNNESPGQDHLFLTADMSISCTSSYYNRWIVYSTLMIIVYPFGISCIYGLFLYLNRKEISQRVDKSSLSKEVKRLSFLYDSYEPKYWYWEIVETGRRLILTAVLSVIKPGSSTQNIVSIVLAFCFACVYSYFGPYVEDDDDTEANLGQAQIFFTFFVALIIQNSLLSSNVNEGLGLALVLMNMLILLYLFTFLLKKVTSDEDRHKRKHIVIHRQVDSYKEIELVSNNNNSDFNEVDDQIIHDNDEDRCIDTSYEPNESIAESTSHVEQIDN